MKIMNFEKTWCEYLTLCPHRDDDTMIGGWECCGCDHHVYKKMIDTVTMTDYINHGNSGKGEVGCKFEDHVINNTEN